jgi:Flp pilus assembly protein TadD
MPPWLPEAGHSTFVGTRHLTDAQIATIQTWVDTGAPQGDPSLLAQQPKFPDGWQLRKPDLVVTLGQPFDLPAQGPDQFRNFVIPVTTTVVKFVEAFEIRTGNPAVHHAILQVDRTERSKTKDTAEAGPGFSGMEMGGSTPPDGHFLGWTLGKRPRPLPLGMAWRLYPGSDLVLQLHLTPTGKPERVQPKIGLYFTEKAPQHYPISIPLFSEAIDIPAGASTYIVRDHFELPAPLRVLGLYPHAHYLCKNMQGSVRLPDGSQKTLIEIPQWDFDWQDDYQFKTPIDLPAGSRITFEYRYDNSTTNPANPNNPPKRVRFGQESTDEMGTLTLTALPVDERGRLALQEAIWHNTIRKKPHDWDAYLRLAQTQREQGRVPEALNALREALRRKPDYPDALCELGLCLLQSSAGKDAEKALRQALNLEPKHPGAHYGLGQLLLSRGDMPGAEREFQVALAAAPEWVDVHISLGNTLARRGATPAAIVHFKRVTELRPEIPEAHNNLATALFSLGKHVAAATSYRQALQLRPDYFNARFNLGRAMIADGQASAGRAELLKAAKLRPNDPAVKAALDGK